MQCARRTAAATLAETALTAAAHAEAAIATASTPEAVSAAVTTAVHARCAASTAALRASSLAAQHARQTFVISGERPSPALTSLLRPPASIRPIPSLRRPDGSLATNPTTLPQIMADYWRDICSPPTTPPAARAAAQAAVLASLARHTPRSLAAAQPCLASSAPPAALVSFPLLSRRTYTRYVFLGLLGALGRIRWGCLQPRAAGLTLHSLPFVFPASHRPTCPCLCRSPPSPYHRPTLLCAPPLCVPSARARPAASWYVLQPRVAYSCRACAVRRPP